MTHYILCGSYSVASFNNQDWKSLEEEILETNEGEIIAFNTSEFKNGLHELLNSLSGWNDFIELSKDDLELISKNTLIEIQEPNETTQAIYWSTADFEKQADENFKELKQDNPEEFKNLDTWEQLYDKSKFTDQLQKMIENHDATEGINWLTIENYLMDCEIKQNQKPL